MTIKTTLENLKNNGWSYYPTTVGGKLHINRDGNLYMLVRNDTHEIVCQWNKHTGVMWVLGELAWHEKKVINQIIAIWRPGTRLTGRPGRPPTARRTRPYFP